MIDKIMEKLLRRDVEDGTKIDNKYLDIRTARRNGGAIYLALTGYIEKGRKYVVKKVDKKVIIESVEHVKLRCQEWSKMKCEDCEEFKECRLSII